MTRAGEADEARREKPRQGYGGALDLAKLGLTPDQFAKATLADAGLNDSAEDVLDAFLSSRGP